MHLFQAINSNKSGEQGLWLDFANEVFAWYLENGREAIFIIWQLWADGKFLLKYYSQLGSLVAVSLNVYSSLIS